MQYDQRVLQGVALLVAILGIFSGACSRPQSVSPEFESGKALADKQVLTVRFNNDPVGFDPAQTFGIEQENIEVNVYSGLTTYDSKTSAIVPDLAVKWETTDQKTWTFHLRHGVQWQKDYGELTAADVLYSFNRVLDKATASPYRAEFNNVASIEAPDPYTVVMKLNQPDANFLHQVANYHQGQIVKKEAIEKYGDQYKWNPWGTGPFSLESVTPGSKLVLARHDGYFLGKPTLERIVLPIIKDDDTAAIALQNREVDLAMFINLNQTLQRLGTDERFAMNSGSTFISLTIFNQRFKPLSDVRVRKAWAHAIDRDAIIKATTPLTTKRAWNLINDWMDVYTPEVPRYEYNPEKAKQLLTEAGYANGFTVKQLASSSVSETAQLEQSYLSKVGIKLEFEIVDRAANNNRRNSGDFEVAGRGLPGMNPDTLLFSYLHPDNMAPKGLNGASYNNPELTAKLEAARAEGDPARRKQLYADVQRIALTDLPYLPNSVSTYYWPGYKWVTGVTINPLAEVNFYGISIAAH